MRTRGISRTTSRFVRQMAIIGFVIGLVTVSVLSLTPSESLPTIDVWDKLQHVLAYLILTVTGAVAFPARHRLPRLAVGLVILGSILEAAQAVVPGRFATIEDAIANVFGVGLGLTIARIVGSRYHFG